MKKEEIKPTGVETESREMKFLVCDTFGSISDSPWEEKWVASPIQCLDKAVEWKPKVIVVSFMRISIREREALLELSAALKRNSHTKQCTVLALLPSKHRKLTEDPKQAKVDYIRYLGDAKPDSNLVRGTIQDLGPADSPGRHLEILCPFLHYSKIDSQHEMTVCRAYLDRMVLGARRLQQWCETENHLLCEHYLDPRVK
ncbi:MAG: hypothetical protein K9M96_01125 [Deltaproteobacteria bacterium]|nr:hypothetical protein [Deltaproteobacteria bacterium]